VEGWGEARRAGNVGRSSFTVLPTQAWGFDFFRAGEAHTPTGDGAVIRTQDYPGHRASFVPTGGECASVRCGKVAEGHPELFFFGA